MGSGGGARNLFTFIASYEATISRSVVVNLENITESTTEVTQNGVNEIILGDTTGVLAGMIVTGSSSIPANTTVSGVTDDAIYLSADTTGTILTGTTLSFSYTPFTLGINPGDTVNISGSGVTNLDGTWPVSGATDIATSFTIQTDDLVTALATDIPAGTHTINNSLILRNETIIVGNAETNASPSNAVIKGTDGLGTDVGGGSVTVEAGLGTGNGTGGDIVLKTGEVTTTGDNLHVSTERVRIDTVGKVTVTGYAEFTDTTGIKVPVGTTAQRPGEVGVGTSVAQGQIRFNTSDTTFEGYDGTNWGSLGGVKDVDQDTFISAETSAGADNDELDFYTANVQRMQIGATGNLSFGDGLNKFTVAYTTGNATFAGDLVVDGDLTISGTTTTLDTTTLIVEDKNIELGNVATPTDITANGGGITLKGDTDHTITWNVTNDAWEFTESINVANTMVYRINNTDVLSATTLGAGVQNSSLIGVGTLTSGSITTTFGDINIGTSTFTGNGSGLTTLNATNLSSGTVAGARLGGNQTMTGVKTFSDTTNATNTTTGAVRVGGGMGVAGDLFAGSLNTADGSGIDGLNATNLDSGTVPNARISGSYSNLTGTGALDAGSITSNFGNINIGTSTFTGNGSGLTNISAETLDGIDSTQFLRSDVADTMEALLTIAHAGDEILRLQDSSATGSPYMSFYQSTDRRAYIQYADVGDVLYIANEGGNTRLNIDGGTGGLTWYDGTATYTVWHSGNDGSGSGLDADSVDGLDSGSFIRSDANDSFSGTLSGSGNINITGNVTATLFTGDGSGLTGIGADDADTLDGLDSTQFLRSDAADVKTSGTLKFDDNVQLNFGTGDDAEIYHNGSALYFDMNADDNIYFRDGNSSNSTRFSFFTSTGNFTATGEVTAYSDITLKDNIEVVADPLTKILNVRGVTFTRKDQDDKRLHMGVIAQEIEEVFPEVVHTNEEGIKSVNYGAMAGAFIEAFKEQQRQIDQLKEMINKLTDK